MAHQCLFVVVVVVMVMVMTFNIYSVESFPAIDASRASTCRLPAAKGHCRALLPRWMYNPATGTCQEFDFGGCDGNGNNFMSFKACMATCGGI